MALSITIKKISLVFTRTTLSAFTKMKRLSLALVFFLGTFMCVQAQTYSELLSKMLTIYTTENSPKTFAKKAVSQIGAGAYIYEQMSNDLIEILSPYYQNTMTLEEMKELVGYYDDPGIKQAIEHFSQVNFHENADDKETSVKAIGAMLRGEKAKGVKLKKGMSRDYAKKCMMYIESTSSHLGIISTYSKTETSGLSIGNAIASYLKNDESVRMVNQCFEKVTNVDMENLSRIMETMAFQHMAEANREVRNNMGDITSQIKEKARAWTAKL